MSNPAVPSPARSRPPNCLPWIIVGLVILLTGSIRFRLVDLPLERDEGEYACIGQLIRQGIPPYQQAYNMKLPGTYLAYAAGMSVFGETTEGVHLMGMVVNAITIPLIFLLGRRLWGAGPGIAATVSYAVLSISPGVGGLAAHANHFVVLFAVPGCLLLLQAVESQKRIKFLGSGLLFGLAFLMKQQGLFFGLFALTYFAWNQLRRRPVDWPDFLRGGWLLALGMVIPFAITCVLLAWAGVFPKFWFWTFTYARNYATELSPSEGWQMFLGYSRNNGAVFSGFILLVVSGIGIALCGKWRPERAWWLGAFVVFSFLAVATGFYFRRQYFILLLPGFSLAIGFTIKAWQEFSRSKTSFPALQAVPFLVLTLVCIAFVFAQRSVFFQLTPVQACRAIYPGNPFVDSVTAAEFIRTNSTPEDSLAVLGSEPQIYFYAHRPLATGHIYTYALMEPQPFASTMQRDMIQQIENAKPRFLVEVAYTTSWLPLPNSDLTILRWMRQYSSQFYERVAIIDTLPNGESMFVSGPAVKGYRSASTDQYISIYRRKMGE